jgi:tetratricopeptide (TPR) repeat protein
MRRFVWVAGLALAAGACTPMVPERVRLYAEDGVHLYHKGSYAEARDSFQAALALMPADPNLIFNVGQCHDQLGQFDRAEALYRDCLGRSPEHAECRHALTALLQKRGKHADALANVEDWFRRAPQKAGPYAEHGWLLQQDGDRGAAQRRFQQALAIDPHNNLALIELARHYEATDHRGRALVLYERALQANPNQPAVAHQVALLRAKGATRPRPD